MPEIPIIKGLTYHPVYFQKSLFLFKVALDIWADIL
jgi:hypothetical protein